MSFGFIRERSLDRINRENFDLALNSDEPEEQTQVSLPSALSLDDYLMPDEISTLERISYIAGKKPIVPELIIPFYLFIPGISNSASLYTANPAYFFSSRFEVQSQQTYLTGYSQFQPEAQYFEGNDYRPIEWHISNSRQYFENKFYSASIFAFPKLEIFYGLKPLTKTEAPAYTKTGYKPLYRANNQIALQVYVYESSRGLQTLYKLSEIKASEKDSEKSIYVSSQIAQSEIKLLSQEKSTETKPHSRLQIKVRTSLESKLYMPSIQSNYQSQSVQTNSEKKVKVIYLSNQLNQKNSVRYQQTPPNYPLQSARNYGSKIVDITTYRLRRDSRYHGRPNKILPGKLKQLGSKQSALTQGTESIKEKPEVESDKEIPYEKESDKESIYEKSDNVNPKYKSGKKYNPKNLDKDIKPYQPKGEEESKNKDSSILDYVGAAAGLGLAGLVSLASLPSKLKSKIKDGTQEAKHKTIDPIVELVDDETTFPLQLRADLASIVDEAKQLGYGFSAMSLIKNSTNEYFGIGEDKKPKSGPSENKVAIAFAAGYLAQQGVLNLEKLIDFDPEFDKDCILTRELGRYSIFKEKGQISYKQLREFMLRESVNTAANVILKFIGNGNMAEGQMRVERMMTQLGLHDIRISHYLPDGEYLKGVTSTKSAAILQSYIAQGKYLEPQYLNPIKEDLESEVHLEYERNKLHTEDGQKVKSGTKITFLKEGAGFAFHFDDYSGAVLFNDPKKPLWSDEAKDAMSIRKYEIETMSATRKLFGKIFDALQKYLIESQYTYKKAA